MRSCRGSVRGFTIDRRIASSPTTLLHDGACALIHRNDAFIFLTTFLAVAYPHFWAEYPLVPVIAAAPTRKCREQTHLEIGYPANLRREVMKTLSWSAAVA